MNRRAFFGGLLAAACSSMLKFYPAPEKEEILLYLPPPGSHHFQEIQEYMDDMLEQMSKTYGYSRWQAEMGTNALFRMLEIEE